jgi:hypothetical protein
MPRRLILFGAFDRHNFGDLLLAHCEAADHAGRRPVFAGVAARDLRAFGGQEVSAVDEVIARLAGEAADFIHVGGELLTTTAWEAAVMLQSRDEARAVVAALDRDPAARDAWAVGVLGHRRLLPYLMPAAALPAGWRVGFHGVGGVGFAALAPAARAEALAALREAAFVSVRDPATCAALRNAGLTAALVPDAASRTPALFGERIARRAEHGELAVLARRMPRWIALQLAAAWGDDACLTRIAAAVARCAVELDAGVVLFRAGLAPWHDDTEVVDRLAAWIAAESPALPLERFASADVFDICALLARAQAYVGTSLHGWIVAESFGVPGVCLVEDGAAKAARYIDCWNTGPAPAWVSRDRLPEALHVLLRIRGRAAGYHPLSGSSPPAGGSGIAPVARSTAIRPNRKTR